MNFTTLKRRLLELDTTQISDADNSIKIMSSHIHPYGVKANLVGIAFTVKTHRNIYAVLDALNRANENNVLIIDSGNSSSAMAGELFAAEAKRKKLAGIIIDGFCRDIEGIKASGFPVFAKGITPRKSNNKNKWQLQVSVTCGEVDISPGDIIYADENGIIAISEQNLSAILRKAKAILKQEHTIKKKINLGIPLAELIK